ncbi:MAG: hypothetical protein HYU66_06280 [Armatimonadetes bacterium]|nr:hypothetical protein [Armatimonadota bacterium]
MPEDLLAGLAQVPITPPLGVELAGYGYYLARRATAVDEELCATALVLARGDVRLALVSLDLIGISPWLVARARRSIRSRTGIAQTLVACTHTHSGPAGVPLRGCGEVCPDYLALLPLHIARAVAQAARGLSPATLSYGEADVPGVATNRCEAGGPVHERVEVITVSAGPWRAVVAAFGCHPVSRRSDNTRVCRDFYGPLAGRLAAEQDAVLVGLQGTCGDVNPVLVHTGRTVEVAAALHAGVVAAMAAAEPVEPDLAARSRTVKLPLQRLDPADLKALRARAAVVLEDPDSSAADQASARVEAEWAAARLADADGGAPGFWATELQALRLGRELALACSGGEVFTTFGQRIRTESPFAHTVVVGYANDLVGYIPDRAEYERHGYAADRVPMILDQAPFEPNVGDVLCAATAALLREIEAA